MAAEIAAPAIVCSAPIFGRQVAAILPANEAITVDASRRAVSAAGDGGEAMLLPLDVLGAL